jgi:hypothetical protein
VSAVLSILGSALTLLLAGVMWLAGFFITPGPDAPRSSLPLKSTTAVMAAVFVALSAWGISTGIAIFLRRRWARISILAFATLLTFMSACGMLVILFIQLPATAQRDVGALMPMLRLGMTAFCGALAVIGVWWLVLFNRNRTKEYFAGQEPASESARPLSVTAIAWFLLIGVAFTSSSAIFLLPAILFGIVLTGWASLALYAACAAAQIYLGTGLLRLREGARVGSIAYLCFSAVNNTVSLVRPGYAEMMRELQIAKPILLPAGTATTVVGPTGLFALSAAAIGAVFIFFLVRQAPAFARNQ